MKKYASLLAGTVCSIAAILPGHANAQGAADFLDSSCINAKRDFAEQEQAYTNKVRSIQASVVTMPVPAEFRTEWMKALKDKSRPTFNDQVAPTLRKMNVPEANLDKAYDQWFDDQLKTLKPGELDQLVDKNFRTLAKEEVDKSKSEGDAKFAEARSGLDSGCKTDVGSQILRVALAPVGWIDGNFKASQNEKNGFTAVIHGISGISLAAIANQGALGGDNSEARKLANTFAGGPTSAVRVTLSAIDPTNLLNGGSHEDVVHQVGRALDPSNLFH